MPDSAWFEVLLVLALILVNGALAMSELAIVSSRAARLKTLETQGVAGAAAALKLASDPGRFLSAVQVGITLVGVLSGAISGATLGVRLRAPLIDMGLPANVAEPMAFGLVVAAITYVSLIIGELVPKQIALRDPERIACRVAPAMGVIARAASPAVTLLDLSGRLVLRLLGLSRSAQSSVTEEEIRTLVAEAETAGVLEPEEHQMIAGVLRLADRRVAAVMTPRTEVDMVDLREDDAAIRKALVGSVHSRLVVHNGNPDEVVGVIQAKDLADALLKGRRFRMKSLVKAAPVIPETMDALEVVDVLKGSGIHMGLVHDEYGHFLGVVTSADILEAIVGEFETEAGPAEPDAVQRPDGSWLVSGTMPADEFAELMGLTLPARRDYRTVGGLVLDAASRIPAVGETFAIQHCMVEIVDLDGRRIDKVLASRTRAS